MQEAIREIASCIRIPTNIGVTETSSPTYTSPDGNEEKCIFCGSPIRARPLETGGFTSICECLLTSTDKFDPSAAPYVKLIELLEEKRNLDEKIENEVLAIAKLAVKRYKAEYETFVPKRNLVIGKFDSAILAVDTETAAVETYERLFNGGKRGGA